MRQPQHYMEKANSAWRSFQQIVFERGGLEVVFRHVSNLVIATLILAAGVHAVKHSSSIRVLGILEVEISGYVVAASGVILAVLNLLDGLQKLARKNYHVTLRVLVVLLYLFFYIRIMQLMSAFRIS